jgi:hypothetical protein
VHEHLSWHTDSSNHSWCSNHMAKAQRVERPSPSMRERPHTRRNPRATMAAPTSGMGGDPSGQRPSVLDMRKIILLVGFIELSDQRVSFLSHHDPTCAPYRDSIRIRALRQALGSEWVVLSLSVGGGGNDERASTSLDMSYSAVMSLCPIRHLGYRGLIHHVFFDYGHRMLSEYFYHAFIHPLAILNLESEIAPDCNVWIPHHSGARQRIEGELKGNLRWPSVRVVGNQANIVFVVTATLDHQSESSSKGVYEVGNSDFPLRVSRAASLSPSEWATAADAPPDQCCPEPIVGASLPATRSISCSLPHSSIGGASLGEERPSPKTPLSGKKKRPAKGGKPFSRHGVLSRAPVPVNTAPGSLPLSSSRGHKLRRYNCLLSSPHSVPLQSSLLWPYE